MSKKDRTADIGCVKG